MFTLLLAAPALAVDIFNTAYVTYEVGGSSFSLASNQVTVSTPTRTPATLEIFQYTPNTQPPPGFVVLPIEATAYSTSGAASGPYAALPPPTSVDGNPIDIGNPVPLSPGTLLSGGMPLFLQLADGDQNLDPSVAETVLVTVVCADTGDSELLRLTETGPNTGLFTGYLQTINGSSAAFDGTLAVTQNSKLTADYQDSADSSDTATAGSLVDPVGIVFDSITGQPLTGAVVTLINAATGLPATVFGQDGVSSFPASVVTGTGATDSGGTSYNFPPGGFRFPLVPPGSYRLDVLPTPGYNYPSVVPTADIQALPGAPFAIQNPGSRNEDFPLNPGPALNVDLPVDPVGGGLWLQKQVDLSVAAIGDFLQYRLSLENTSSGATATGVTISDTLPPGFRYRGGSTRSDDARQANPAISANGQNLQFSIGSLAPGARREITYVVEVTAGAHLGDATNRAVATDINGSPSNQATAVVAIVEDLFRSKTLIVGRVSAGSCDQEEAAVPGVPGIRLLLEDGTTVLTDLDGRYHFEGIEAGVHVVQLDLASLPEGYQPVLCDPNTRSAGSAFSRFVDLQGGTLWRVDFRLEPLPAPQGEIGLQLRSTQEQEQFSFEVALDGTGPSQELLRLTLALPEGMEYLPGSSRHDGNPITDPDAVDGVLSYDLPAVSGTWQSKLTLQAGLLPGTTAGERPAIAILQAADATQTPEAATRFSFQPEQSSATATFLARPVFPSGEEQLTTEQQQLLDRLVTRLNAWEVVQVQVMGHTDNVPIAPQGQERYADNQALAMARARQVGAYLQQELKLQPDQVSLVAQGSNEPIADNALDEGRRLNRRADVLGVARQPKGATGSAQAPPQQPLADQLAEATGFGEVQIISSEQQQPASAAVTLAESPRVTTTTTAPVTAPVDYSTPPEPEPLPEGLLQPVNGDLLVDRIAAVRVNLPTGLKPRLLLDGQEISADRIGYSYTDNTTERSFYSYIGVDFGEPGQHQLKIEGIGPFGNARYQQEATIIRTGQPASIWLLDAGENFADGSTPVRIRLELRDDQDLPIHAPVTLKLGKGTLQATAREHNPLDPVPADQAVEVDRDGWAEFAAVNQAGPYHALISYNEIEVKVQTYVKPMLRDWVLVGLAEGTAGYNTVSGNLEPLAPSDVEDNFHQDNRIAFFAQGKIKGEWLLTMAYDSDKSDQDGQSLFQVIDPGTYYTVYGDASEQGYLAASARKVYLRLERDQFYALFGDFDTGLTVTELSRYNRRMNGFKAELRDNRFGFNVFASDTNQQYNRDEIQGDGTSGLYHLSRNDMVLNGESIRLETRDRFHSEQILETRELIRYLDYDIDYTAGTLFFKQPIPSKDADFNPIYIVAEYEVGGTQGKSLNYGGRGMTRLLNDRLEVGATYVHEDQGIDNGNLYGFDAEVQLNARNSLRVEAATSKRDFSNISLQGDAYLVEAQHRGKRLEGRTYYQRIEAQFGLDQQNLSERGTQKYGIEGGYIIHPGLSVGGEFYHQDNLNNDARRNVYELNSRYQRGALQWDVGLLQADDTFSDGRKDRSRQLYTGGQYSTLGNRVTLRARQELSLDADDNQDYPTRTLLGVDYKLNSRATLFADQEFTWGGYQDTQSTRGGIKATPWKGGEFNSSMEQQIAENGERVFANVGLHQSWQATQNWGFGASLDRSHTIRSKDYRPFSEVTPPASGSREDFTAVSLGSSYRTTLWTWDSRVEFRDGDQENKYNLVTGMYGQLRRYIAVSAGLNLQHRSGVSDETYGELTAGLAYRPRGGRWIVLERFTLRGDRTDGNQVDKSVRLINNLNANLKLNRKTQISLQYGAKYVLEQYGSDDYDGYTDLIGIEGRYDLTNRWDVGLYGSMLHSWHGDQIDYRAGGSLGYNPMDNVWISLGYNIVGFDDPDFSKGDYTAQGPFVRFRLKVDQNTAGDLVSYLKQH